jgi:cobalt/nickel transport system permease protein
MRPESQARGLLYRAPAATKLGLASAIVLGTTLLPPKVAWVYLFPAGFVLGLWVAARIPLGQGIRRLVVAEFFIIGIGLFALLFPAHGAVFLSAFLKSNICVTMMIVLTWTTPFSEILAVFRRLSIPSVMLTTLALMYRYLPVLADESRRMDRARKSRTFSAGRMQVWHNLSTIVAQLFIRSVDRAERIYLAMCARGWK